MEKVQENKIKILLVDDDPLMLTILKNRYESRGYGIYTAASGEEALEIFEKERPSIVISDYVMRGMDGDELCIKLKKLDSKVKILMLTGQKLDNFVIRAMKSGADDYMTKPFSPVELDFKIEKLLKG
ncbi:MAG: response regulator [Tepidanaerobacteraceae bacterium]|jgi:DNA-binding response OmpR family regulator|nr:response regulator [Tepidanaerobacteraceae bacterium]